MPARATVVRDGRSRPSLFASRYPRRHAILLGAICALAGLGRPATAQLFARPWLDWQTLHAGRFDVNYPTALEGWARFVASRMPAVDSAVTTLVGYSPPMHVQIVIEDPFDISNGFAFTLLDKPVIVFWASPPDPRESIGQFRTWGEMLATHEFGHVAHLTRPSRNPFTRLLWRVSPVDLGPIALRAPRWVIEGYATYIEGKVTGSGRPHGFWRPATLRQWAIEGRLPTYDQLSSWNDFEGGEFAYLAGSAFLEWLAARAGDSSLVHVWRRLTARTNRSFDEAFIGVFGDSPRILYGRFAAQLTAESVGIDSALARVEVAGEMVQHLTRGTGDPAISPDGKRAALVLRAPGRPARVVIWSTAPESDSMVRKARERLLARDPEDVPARQFYPLPKRALATLAARDGRAYENPRWFPDGRRLLLWRATRRPDGSLRPELYEWSPDAHRVRRLTRAGDVREADPAPDGRSAVALHCAGGFCDIVVVDLATGSVRVLRHGDVYTSFARPRWGPDARTIAVAMQRENRWRIALLDAFAVATTPLRFADPDDGANRFDPAWLEPNALLVTSDRSGTANVERLDLPEGSGQPVAHALTRVAGAAIAPEPNRGDGSLWFLSLHSQGYDVRRLPSPVSIGESAQSPLLNSRLAPATIEPSGSVRAFAPATLPGARAYGIGPRTTRWVPGASLGAGGRAATLAIVDVDPVGRLTILGQGAFGNGDAWRGGNLDLAWRRFRPLLRASFFDALSSNSSRNRGLPFLVGGTSELRGGRARLDYTHSFDISDVRVGFGAAPGQLRSSGAGTSRDDRRNLAFGELAADARQSTERATASESFAGNFAAGSTGGGESYRRVVGTLALHGGARGFLPLDLTGSYGRVTARSAPFEQFLVGGLASTLIDPSLLTQRIVMGALPLGIAAGDRAALFRVSTDFSGIAPFYWAASARSGDGRFAVWHRVVGVELAIDQGPVSVLGLPGARFVAGVGQSLDTPVRHQTRGYFTVSLRP
jgi:Tol biopolymer transport system component